MTHFYFAFAFAFAFQCPAFVNGGGAAVSISSISHRVSR